MPETNQKAYVLIVIAEKPFRGEEELIQKGAKICHSSNEPGVANAFRAMKKGGVQVYVVERVSDTILCRMISKAQEFGNSVETVANPEELLSLFK